MTRKFWFIRHGESVSNAGLKTKHPKTVTLTQNGEAQAQSKADKFQRRPDLIITSPYLRTKQTAAPFFEKFGDVPQEEWNIHEYTYLPHALYNGTTNDDRRPAMREYWDLADPFHRTSPEAESFADFAARCQNTLERMKQCQEGLTVAFSHGYFINGLLLCLQGGFQNMGPEAMAGFLQHHRTNRIDNCALFEFTVTNDAGVVFDKHDMEIREEKSDGLAND